MSAYVVDRDHIIYLVDAARKLSLARGNTSAGSDFSYWNGSERVHLRCGDDEAAAKAAQMLWDANILSVLARYPDDAKDVEDAKRIARETGESPMPGPIKEDFDIGDDFPFIHNTPEPLQVLHSCSCYEYQSCETETWELSEAWRFIDSLRAAAIRRLQADKDLTWGSPKLVAGRTGTHWMSAKQADEPTADEVRAAFS